MQRSQNHTRRVNADREFRERAALRRASAPHLSHPAFVRCAAARGTRASAGAWRSKRAATRGATYRGNRREYNTPERATSLLDCGGENRPRPTRGARVARASPTTIRAGEGSLRTERRPKEGARQGQRPATGRDKTWPLPRLAPQHEPRASAQKHAARVPCEHCAAPERVRDVSAEKRKSDVAWRKCRCSYV